MKKTLLLIALMGLSSCAMIPSIPLPFFGEVNISEQLENLSDDNGLEEIAENVIESGIKVITGEDVHIDITGDSPECGSKKN